MKKEVKEKCSWATAPTGSTGSTEPVSGIDSPPFIKELLQDRDRELVEFIEKFDITSGIHGEPVKNPLMRFEDVKRFLLEDLITYIKGK